MGMLLVEHAQQGPRHRLEQPDHGSRSAKTCLPCLAAVSRTCAAVEKSRPKPYVPLQSATGTIDGASHSGIHIPEIHFLRSSHQCLHLISWNPFVERKYHILATIIVEFEVSDAIEMLDA
jgi:hypothetical protein